MTDRYALVNKTPAERKKIAVLRQKRCSMSFPGSPMRVSYHSHDLHESVIEGVMTGSSAEGVRPSRGHYRLSRVIAFVMCRYPHVIFSSAQERQFYTLSYHMACNSRFEDQPLQLCNRTALLHCTHSLVAEGISSVVHSIRTPLSFVVDAPVCRKFSGHSVVHVAGSVIGVQVAGEADAGLWVLRFAIAKHPRAGR